MQKFLLFVQRKKLTRHTGNHQSVQKQLYCGKSLKAPLEFFPIPV